MDQEFLNQLKTQDEVFSGWDFSFVSETGRMSSSLLTWSFGSLAMKKLAHAKSALDMGTGGGEHLSYLRPFPPVMKATEGYMPNVSIAKNRLEALGVKVYEVTNDQNLPFKENEFDLILNKHESFDANEVRRLISNGGTFMTQQVGGTDCAEINEWFNQPLNPEFAQWNLETARQQVEAAGFHVTDAKEEFPTQRFYDLGAVLYYLKAIPWQLEDWRASDYIPELYKLYERINKDGFVEVTQHRFILIAQ